MSAIASNCTPTSISELNVALGGGIAPGESHQVIGITGGGKTVMAVQLVRDFVHADKKVLLITTEQSPDELLPRLVSSCLDIPYGEIHDSVAKHDWIPEEQRRFEDLISRLDANSRWVEWKHNPIITVQTALQPEITGFIEEHGRMDLLVIDRIDHILHTVKHADRQNYQQYLREAFAFAAKTAKQHDAAFVGVAQASMDSAPGKLHVTPYMTHECPRMVEEADVFIGIGNQEFDELDLRAAHQTLRPEQFLYVHRRVDRRPWSVPVLADFDYQRYTDRGSATEIDESGTPPSSEPKKPNRRPTDGTKRPSEKRRRSKPRTGKRSRRPDYRLTPDETVLLGQIRKCRSFTNGERLLLVEFVVFKAAREDGTRVTAKRLAERLGMTHGAARTAIHRLREKGYIDQEGDGHDGKLPTRWISEELYTLLETDSTHDDVQHGEQTCDSSGENATGVSQDAGNRTGEEQEGVLQDGTHGEFPDGNEPLPLPSKAGKGDSSCGAVSPLFLPGGEHRLPGTESTSSSSTSCPGDPDSQVHLPGKTRLDPEDKNRTDPASIPPRVSREDWLHLLADTPEYQAIIKHFDSIDLPQARRLGRAIRKGQISSERVLLVSSDAGICKILGKVSATIDFLTERPVDETIRDRLDGVLLGVNCDIQGITGSIESWTKNDGHSYEQTAQIVRRIILDPADPHDEIPFIFESGQFGPYWLVLNEWVAAGLDLKAWEDKKIRNKLHHELLRSPAAVYYLQKHKRLAETLTGHSLMWYLEKQRQELGTLQRKRRALVSVLK